MEYIRETYMGEWSESIAIEGTCFELLEILKLEQEIKEREQILDDKLLKEIK